MCAIPGDAMKIKVKFFATFIETFGFEEMEVEFERGCSVLDLINNLCDSVEHRRMFFKERDKLKPYVKVLKNGRFIEHLSGLNTKLVDGDVIAVFPPVGGG